MKCRDCDCCKKGFYKSIPDEYICTGVKEPFVIMNIDNECSEYPEYRYTDCKWKEMHNVMTIEEAEKKFGIRIVSK